MVAILLCLMLIAPGASGHGEERDPSGPSRNEPAVSRKEAAILHEAEEKAETNVRQAIDILLKAMDEESSAALDFALGCFYYENENVDQAIQAFRGALKKMPSFNRARENLARILLQEERYDSAAKELAYLLDADGTDKKSLWKMLGYAYLMWDRPVAAEVAYRNAIVLSPEDKDLPLMLIRAMMEQEKYLETGPLIERELAASPLQEELWKLYANIDLSTRQNLEALVKLECACRLGVASPETRVTLGDLFLEQKMPDEALKRYAETTAMDHPPVSRLLNALEGFVHQGDNEKAHGLLGALKRAGHAMTDAQRMRQRYLEARLSEREGGLDGALRSYEALLAENPLDVDALLAAGRILHKQKKFEEAFVYYERAARISPEHEAESLVRQAQIAVERNDYKHAEQLLNRALEIKPETYIERYLEQVRRMLE